MTTRRFIGAVMIALMILLAACNTTTTATPDLAATVAVNVAVAQTAAAYQTSVASTSNAVQPLMPSETPTLDASLQATPTSQYTATPDYVMLTLTRDTYCRTGATSTFPSVALLRAGLSVEVKAQNPSMDSYYVVFPPQSTSYCWVWGEYATISNDQQVLPVITSQPEPTVTYTPRPQPDFTVSYANMQSCGADFYFRFNIKNTGGITWQSIQINLLDSTASVSTTHSNTSFVDYSGCAASFSQSDLTAGEQGSVAAYNTGQFTYDPTGHNITATFTFCQTDAFGGCINKSISFTP